VAGFILAAASCFAMSSVYHLCGEPERARAARALRTCSKRGRPPPPCAGCHSEYAYETLYRCDLSGITALILGSYVPGLFYAFSCWQGPRIFYTGESWPAPVHRRIASTLPIILGRCTAWKDR
jgi:predicted membrane channel-forming protein YqfA (hemolysin III family)